MNERLVQIRVGIVSLAAILLTVSLVLLIGDFPKLFTKRKTYYIEVLQAPGVSEGTPVRMSGIHVGRVTNIEFVQPVGVRVTLEVDDRVKIFPGDTCRVSESLLGDAKLEFVRVRKPVADATPLPSGETVQGSVAASPLDSLAQMQGDIQQTLVSINQASESFTRAGDEVAGVAKQINELLDSDPGNTDQLFGKLATAADNFNKAMIQVNKILGDEEFKGDIRVAFEQLPLMLAESRETIAKVQEMVERADQNLENLEGLTKPLGEKGPQIAATIVSGTERLDEVMDQLLIFTERLNDEEGSLSQLVGNPELYRNLNKAAQNIERLSTDLQPIVKDLRVFSDKIARDPGQLGVSGALQRNRGTKYPNYDGGEAPPADWRAPLR